MGNAPGTLNRRQSAFIESNIPPPDLPVEILSDGGSSGTTTPPVIIEMVTDGHSSGTNTPPVVIETVTSTERKPLETTLLPRNVESVTADNKKGSKKTMSPVIEPVIVGTVASGKEDSAKFVQQLHKRLTEEHRQIIQKIEADLELSDPQITNRHSQDSQTDGQVDRDDTVSVISNPTTASEIQHAEQRQKAVQKAQDVQKSLDQQVEDINTLRTQMLGEYEQMLSVRAEVMASQSQEVEKLQAEMAQIQQQYELQMSEFQDKVTAQTEAALKDTHEKELEDMKQFYETKVSEMEKSYTTDIAQLKQEHNELIARLQQENGAAAEGELPTQQLTPGKHREYVHRTTTLTAISDEEETPPSTPSGGSEMLEGRIKILEEKLKDKETLVAELKKRFEAEATSAEDLHGRLLDSNKTLDDYEESLKSKGEEIEELKQALSSKDVRISELESEKAALEERGEKDKPTYDADSEKCIKELNERITKLEEELSTSKDVNAKIQDEMNQLNEQHGEAIVKLKEEMENLNKVKLEEAETVFQIQLEEELKQQADDINNKYKEELDIYKKTESELKQRLNSVQLEHDKQLEELREKYDTESKEKSIEPKTDQDESIEIPAASSSLDKDSLESIRENVRAEILKEYEESIDKLKSEYEEKISEMNSRIQSYEAQDIEKAELADKEKLTGEQSDSELRESLRSELAREFKDRLQNVTDEYETKLKKLQDIVDSRKEVKSPGAPFVLARSRSLDRMPQKDVERPKTEYDGYVATIRKEYEDKINSLQMQIAQYRSTVGSVPSTPLSASQKSPQLLSASDGGSVNVLSPSEVAVETPKKSGPKDSIDMTDDAGVDYASSVQDLKENYDKQLQEVSQKLSDLQAEGSTQVVKDYEAIIEKLKQDYEAQISELKDEHAKEIKDLNNQLEKAQADKLAAEQKVKADMFVWHEEIMTQMKRQHEADVSQLRKEYEEKMDLFREEMQEEFDNEKQNIIQEHKREMADLEERYDNLVEGIRSGEVPEVAEMFQEKYDMELEMAKTLIQQECDETIESEQSRLSEQFEQQMQESLAAKDKVIEELQTAHEKALVDLKESLLLQYQSQTVELESAHQEAIHEMNSEYETLLRGAQTEGMTKSESMDIKSIQSDTTVDEGEDREEDQDKVTVDSTGDKSDRDKDGDDNDGGKGGATAHSQSPTDEQQADKHQQETKSDSTTSETKDDGDNTGRGGEDKIEKEIVSPVVVAETVTVNTASPNTASPSTVTPTSNLSIDSTDTPISEIITSESSESLSAVIPETVKPAVKSDSTVPDVQSGEVTQADSDLIDQLRHQLAGQIAEYVATIAQLKASQEEEIRQLTEDIADIESKYQEKIHDLEETHEQDIKQYQESIEKLRQGLGDLDDDEALDAAHQQELQDLEERLVQKHMNELNNLETQHQSKMDEMAEKHQTEITSLQQLLEEAQRAVEQYPDVASPIQTVPTFRETTSSLGSTQQSVTDDFTVPDGDSTTDTVKPVQQQPQTVPANMDTQKFDAQSVEDRSEEDPSQGGSLQGTLDEVGVQSLDTSVALDTSMDQSRGTLRGVDTTQDTDLIQFYEDEESDKSIEEDTQKSDASGAGVLLQTMGYGADVTTVKSLDDTTDSSYRESDREKLVNRIKELENEVVDLRQKLQGRINQEDEQMERLAREKQEENTLGEMLRSERDALQATNEHLLGLLSDAVKTYMSVEDTVTKKMKVMMEKSAGEKGAQARPGSAERKRTPPPSRRSPVLPGSPARVEECEGAHDMSVLSNITDEGLDLSTSIFQGPDLASEEEELLLDSGSRLRTSVNHLLDMIEESTTQLIETRQTHTQMLDTIEGKGHDLDYLTARVSDLEERLKEEVERKDFLAIELHKAEGLIEGYSSEHETLDNKIRDLNEQKETLVLELETTRNKLHDLQSMQTENEKLKKEMDKQRELMTHNVGEEAQATRAQDDVLEPHSGDTALMLEVTRLNSENREKEEQFKHVQERYESRVRELETSGEDMESHYNKLLDEKKQEMTDLKLHVESLEKQMKAKKQFLEEQSTEREQEHEQYQQDLDKWKKIVQDLEKQNGAGTRLQREIDDLSEQLQNRIDLHNQALLDSEKYQHECRDKDISIKELKTVIQQLELDIQDKTEQLEQIKQKMQKLEDELSRRPYPDDDMSDTGKSGTQSPKSGSSLEFDGGVDTKKERTPPQMTVEEEMKQAANKTKEELVREKFTLQSNVNENLVLISSLRNQLDDMRHRRGLDVDIPDVTRRLDAEREKSEEKEKEIADLKLRVEELGERVENREQQIEQLREQQARSRRSPVEGLEFESDRELEKQMEAMKRENKQLRERVKLSETSSVTDISGLSQNLIEEKNQEIDHLAEQILRLTSDYNDLKAEKGVQNMCDELEQLREELQRKEKELGEVQNVQVSQAFTDHSLTPDSSLLMVGASFSEKASIQQEMQESFANGLEKMAALETENTTMKENLEIKEEQIISLEAELSSLREDLQGKDEMILAMQVKPMPETDLIQGMPEDIGLLQSMIQEKEELITQLTVQTDSLQSEVDNLSDFQNKLQEDFDIVQTMLEEKDREIESLTKELTDRPPTHSDEHSLVIKHEVEIARLKKDLREKDNVVEEKLEELAELSDKVELLESHITKYKEQSKDYDEQILEKERELKKLKKQLDEATLDSPSLSEKDAIIKQKTVEIERLNSELESVALSASPSPPLTEDEKAELIKEQTEEIESLRKHVQSMLGRPPSPPKSEDEETLVLAQLKAENTKLKEDMRLLDLSPEDGSVADVVQRLRTEIEKLKQQIFDANLSEDDKFVLIRDLRLENDTLKRQIDAALKIRPPSPPLDEDEKSELIRSQKVEIESLKSQVETVRSESGGDSTQVINEQKEKIIALERQVKAALQIAPPPLPLTEDEREAEVVRLKSELNRVIDAIENHEERELIRQKINESIELRAELDDVKNKLDSTDSVTSEKILQEKDIELKKAVETVEKLEEELQSAKEVKAYEDEIALQEKQDEIEELQAELESYRSKTESSLGQSVDLEMSLGGGSETDPKQLVRSMSFYKEQYEEKCSEARQLQVQVDLVKQQLEKIRSDKLEDSPEEIEMFKADLARKNEKEIADLQKVNDELMKELESVREKLGQTADDRVESIENELQLTKDELAKERLDNVQAIKDIETLRDRKERERRGSVKTIQELEQTIDSKMEKEKELNTQVKQLTEELTFIKKQYGIEDKSVTSGSSRASPKVGELKSQGSFELSNDIETLQQQVLQFKQHSDKAREILSEKQKYQSQAVKLEIQYEQLQKEMKKEVGRLEEQLKAYAKQPDMDLWAQLHATQDKLEKTTEQLQETGKHLSETESNLQRVSNDLASREGDIRELQQDLWKTSGQLSVTSGKLQEVEEKLRLTVGQVTEREEQIHQLQGELQHTQLEAEQVSKQSESSPEEVTRLQKKLEASQKELEMVKQSLNEAVEMSEQQLHMVEDKDQEYVKLKLEIQQTLSDKDKTIREQKNKIKEKEQELTKTKQEATKTKQDAAKMKEELDKVKEEVEVKTAELVKARQGVSGRGDSTELEEEVTTLRVRLQNQEEMVELLRAELSTSKSTVEELKSSNDELKSSNQDLEREIESVQESRKQSLDSEADTVQAMHNQIAELQRENQQLRSASKGQGDSSRSQDEEAREASPYDQNGRHVTGGELGISEDRSQDSRPGSRLRSPVDMVSQTEQPSSLAFDDQEDSGHQSFDPSGRYPHFSPEGQSLSPRQLRPFVAETVEEDMVMKDSSQSYTPLSSRQQELVADSYKQPYSPPTRDTGSASSHSSGKSDPHSEGQRSSRTPSGGSPRQRLSPREDSADVRSTHSQSSQGSQHQARGDGDVEQRSPPRDRQTAGSSYTIDEDRNVYQARPEAGSGERSVSESRLSYDRDDNIRPHYSQSVGTAASSQRSADVDLQPERSSTEGQGMSSEAEKYIQQLRRELLITKTALMQIQRGERLDEDDAIPDEVVAMETGARGQGDTGYRAEGDATYDPLPDVENLNRLKKKLEKAEEEIELYRSSSNLSARDFVQKVMNLKDELSNEHQRHIQEMSTRAQQDTETQLATMRIKYTDEIDHIKNQHKADVEVKLRDQKLKMERKYKSDVNKLVIKHQEEVGALKLRAGTDFNDSSMFEREERQRQDGVGADRGLTNGHGTTHMSDTLQNIMRRLHNEGVQVLSISELEYLSRNQSQPLPQDADVESMKAGWENERQTMLSTIQSLKDLLSQTHKLRGLDKDDNDDDDDDDQNLEGSDWRAELLRCIGYVFNKERETLLAELRSHVLSHPSSNVDEIQRLEQKIRTMESHHHSALDQVFNADRQSMLSEIRDLRAHATISRMHQQEEKDRMNEKLTSTEDNALKKERQLKREVQLLEFKIQQEKVLHEDLRLSLESERNRSGELSGLLNREKTSNFDLQTSVTALQSQVAKLREDLAREQSRYVSVTNALEEEKSKSLNLSDLLESERETLHRVQDELETLKNQQNTTDVRVIEELQYELNNERERRCHADSQHEIDMVTVKNLQQEIDMGKRRQHAIETELNAKISHLQRSYDAEKQTHAELNRALDREKALCAHLQQSLEAEQSHSERANIRDRSTLEDLQIQLQTERANLDDINRALQREQKSREEVISEKNLLKDHLNQERALNEELKHELDKVQFERLEAVNKLQKERDIISRLRNERKQVDEDIRQMKSVEIQRDQDREEERLSHKKSVREAERSREEYRMKLNEQELETQRLTQKVCSLEDQLAASQENELKAIRELEHLRVELIHPTDNNETAPEVLSPRHDTSVGSSLDQPDNRDNWQVYRSQLDSMCQSLHYLILRCREQVSKVSFGGGARQLDISDFDSLQRSLRDLLSEVKQLQEMEGEFMNHPSGSVNERILRQNEELTNYIARISEEKTELRNTLTRLEEEISRYRKMDAKYQDMQRRSSGSEHLIVAERAEWAQEKLSLQMALNNAEREIGLLQSDLRVERERRVTAGLAETKDNDKIKIQRLYGKFLRAESFRKALIYQKKYLLLLLGGFQDTEETTLALLSQMGAVDSRNSGAFRHRPRPLTKFRGAVRVVIAVQRMKYMVKKWRRATRVGSEVVAGTVDQSNGYVPQASSFSPPRNGTSSRVSHIPVRSSSSPPVWSIHIAHSPAPVDRHASPRYDVDTYSSSSYTSTRPTTNLTHVPNTPPTHDTNHTTKRTSPSNGARRKILTSTSIPAPRSNHVRFTGDESKSTGSSELGDNDDYIHRLESLHSRLGTLQNGKRSNYRQSWR